MAEVNSLPRAGAVETEKRRFLTRVYGWMAAALVVSGAAAWLTANSRAMRTLLFGNPFGWLILAAAEIVLVFWLSSSIRRISAGAAAVAFTVYSVVNGMTLSSVFMVYAHSSIARVFLISAVMFAAMSLYGMFSRADIRSAGRCLMMGLVGVLIASLVNLFVRSSGLDWIISMATVVIFTGLTAYDSNKILAAGEYADGSEVFRKAAVIGALELYLDFINIFLAMLRLFGRSRD